MHGDERPYHETIQVIDTGALFLLLTAFIGGRTTFFFVHCKSYVLWMSGLKGERDAGSV